MILSQLEAGGKTKEEWKIDSENQAKELERRMKALEMRVQGLKRHSFIVSVSIFIIAITLFSSNHRQQQIISLLDKTNQALDKTVQLLVQSRD